jgi:hypothetical protein
MRLINLRRQVYEWRKGLRHRRSRRRAAGALPPLPPRMRAALAALERDGVFVSSLEELGAGTELLPALDRLFAANAGTSAHAKDYVVHVPDSAIDAAPAVLAWGLGEDILALCANYIGLPVAYRGVSVRRDIANGEWTGTRLWHRDSEDNRILKLIVYVNDVDAATGPFECVPKRFSPPTWRVNLQDGSRVDERDFDRFVPQDRRVACTGPRGTVVIVDTCAVYHRGRLPEAKDRLTAFYCYNSLRPLSPGDCQPMFDRQRFVSGQHLSARQASALDYRY